jgi:DNA primase
MLPLWWSNHSGLLLEALIVHIRIWLKGECGRKSRGTSASANYGGNGYMKGRIVIPIHNEDGVLVAYVGRAPGNAEPKYRFPPRFRKSLVLYNLHRAIAHGKRVIVVEGFFGCLKVHEAGFPCVIALMGASLSQRQEQFIERYFHEVVLMLDGDSAGRTAAAKIAARLVPHLAARVVELPPGSEPDQLSGDQIRCFCDPNYF